MGSIIGILALQGDYHKHKIAVEKLGYDTLLVKSAESLSHCEKLIIPGGESTTLLHLIEKMDMRKALQDFAKNKGIMGTCAGLIVLGKSTEKLPYQTLELIDVNVKRNAYGRQINSFIDTVKLNVGSEKTEFEGVFIRAPKIDKIGPGVRAIGYYAEDVVMAASENILVATFHPELTDDPTVHQYFLEYIG